MPRKNALSIIFSVFVSLAFFSCAQNLFSQSAPMTGALSGTVKSSDGKASRGGWRFRARRERDVYNHGVHRRIRTVFIPPDEQRPVQGLGASGWF